MSQYHCEGPLLPLLPWLSVSSDYSGKHGTPFRRLRPTDYPVDHLLPSPSSMMISYILCWVAISFGSWMP